VRKRGWKKDIEIDEKHRGIDEKEDTKDVEVPPTRKLIGEIWEQVNKHRKLRGKDMNTEVKLRVGDIVKVKDDLVTGVHYNNLLFAEQMEGFKGNIFIIEEELDEKEFFLEGIGRWCFNSEMLELVSRVVEKDINTEVKLRVGDIVKVKDDLIINKQYDSERFTEDMEKFKEGLYTITYAHYDGSWCLNDMHEKYFSDKMLELVSRGGK
jgi:hypothetical protein